MKTTIMKKGYTLRVTSWENDGDLYNTIDTHTDSKEVLKGLIAICDYCSSTGGDDVIANSDIWLSEGQKQRMTQIVSDHPSLIKFIDNDPEFYEDFESGIIIDIAELLLDIQNFT